jgi:hypothetical protein
MAKKNTISIAGPINCACVIHGSRYNWTYVERLYNMLSRQISVGINFHVYTEHDRSVPPHMIKHCLEDWPGVQGPKKSWWHKMQLFNPEHFSGNLLYLDLDVVLFNSLNWVTQSNPDYFWTIRDFRHLQHPCSKMNSSMMWWNVEKFSYVWHEFNRESREQIIKRYHGDQDYLDIAIQHQNKRFWPDQHFQSWRWQCQEGGYDFPRRRHRAPGTPAQVNPDASVIVFHGQPKPHEVNDPIVEAHWR